MKYLLLVFPFWWWAGSSVMVYTQWLDGKLTTFDKVMWCPVWVTFGIVDVFLNNTLFVLLMGFAPQKCYTISTRFEFYRDNPGSCAPWALKFADFICLSLNALVAGGHHC